MRRLIFPIVLGLGGVLILLSLGNWQVNRLAEKEALLAAIEAQIGGPAGPLPENGLSSEGFKYQPVTIRGRTTGDEVLMLSGQKGIGAGYEVIAAFETEDGRKILLDRGFVAETARRSPRPPVALEVTGNLHWPDESDGYTPPPDMTEMLWFARDVPSMAEALGTDPVFVVARDVAGDTQGIVPVPVDTSGIPNDHREYAITWFSLAIVWAGMTGYLVWRIRRQRN